jgi:VCBS repeat-containing protein
VGWSAEGYPGGVYYIKKVPPEAPTPLSPGSSSEPGPIIDTLTPTLQWQASFGADYYALAISEYPYGPSNIIYNPQQIYDTSHRVPEGVLQPGKKYRWNLQAHSSGGWSPVSNTLYFQTSGGKPDLTVIGQVSFTPSSAVRGQSLSVQFTVKNAGSSSSGSFYVRISLATTEYGTDYSLGNFQVSSLSAGESRPLSITTNPIPSSVPVGSYYVTAFVDGFRQIDESNEYNNIGSSTPKKVEIQNQRPTCSISANPRSGKAPLEVTFSMSAGDPDGSIIAWVLDVNGDGKADYSGNGNPPSTLKHTYTSEGSYSIVLMVGDNDGASAVATETVNVGTNKPPTCSISPDKTSGEAPLTVTFAISASDPDGFISKWELLISKDNTALDKKSGSGNPPSKLTYDFVDSGTYLVILNVYDNDGATSSCTCIIDVRPPSTTYDYTISISGLGSGYSTKAYLDGVQKTTLSNGQSYKFSGLTGTHTISVDSVVDDGTNIRYICGSNSITVSASGSHTFSYKTQYYVTMSVSPSGSGAVSPGSSWFDAGSSISISASPASGYRFKSWSTSGSITISNSDSSSTTATINGPGSITANFEKVEQFDFSISISPSTRTIKVGESTTYSITVSSLSGTTQTVTLSLSGQHSTMSYSFNPSSGPPTFTSILTISTTGSTPANTYTLTITGTGGGLTRQKQITLIVETPPPQKVTLTLYVHEGSKDGPLLSGVRVTGYDGVGKSFDQTTDGGYVVIEGTPGRWHFTISKEGYKDVTWDQDITETCTKHAYFTEKIKITYPPTVETRPATEITTTEATLNGIVVSDGGESVDEMRFDWGTTSSCSDGWTNKVAISGNSFSFRLTGLKPGTKYYFRAWAHNSKGWSHGDVLSFATLQLPKAPDLITPKDEETFKSKTIIFSWSSSSGAFEYQIEIIGPTSKLEIVSSTSYKVTLTPGSYTWRVRAHGNAGWSNWSPTRSFTISLPALTITLISPPDSYTADSLPITLKAKVMSEGSPVEGARVTFIVENIGQFPVLSDSNGYASYTIYKLESGEYNWYAEAEKEDYQSTKSQKWSFTYKGAPEETKVIFKFVSCDVWYSIEGKVFASPTVENPDNVKRDVNIALTIQDPEGNWHLMKEGYKTISIEPKSSQSITLSLDIPIPIIVGEYKAKITVWTNEPHKIESKEFSFEVPAESPHPYPNNFDRTWIIKKPGAKQIRIHFKILQLGKGDKLEIEDSKGNRRTFYYATDKWVLCYGDAVKIRLTSDSSENGFGFIIDKIERKEKELPISEEDIFWLTKVLMSEASVGNREEQIAVGWTVINRYKDGRYGKTIEDVVKGRGKLDGGFAWNQGPESPDKEEEWLSTKADEYERSEWLKLKTLARQLLSEEYPDPTRGALYFFSPRSMRPEDGYGPYEIPGTGKTAYIPSWALPEGYSENNLPPPDWKMTPFYKTIPYDEKSKLEWVSGIPEVRNWYFMFYRPCKSP